MIILQSVTTHFEHMISSAAPRPPTTPLFTFSSPDLIIGALVDGTFLKESKPISSTKKSHFFERKKNDHFVREGEFEIPFLHFFREKQKADS